MYQYRSKFQFHMEELQNTKMAEEVKLLGFSASPFSCRVKLALKFKGIQYQYIEEDLKNKTELLVKCNPVHKKIPVLVHNGKPIAESLVILEYIDETWPNNPILPQDPYTRALARFWANFVDDKIVTAPMTAKAEKGKEVEYVMEEIYGYLKFLEDELKGKELFGGENIGYVDIVAFVILHWIQVLREDILKSQFVTEEKFPALHKWMQKLREIDFINECLPPRDQHVALFKAYIEDESSVSK